MASTEKNTLIMALDVAIKRIPRDVAGQNKKRYACYQHFKMGRAQVKRFNEWFKNPSSLTNEEMDRIREVLGALTGAIAKSTPEISPDYSRKILRHVVSVLSSLKTLVVDVDQNDVTDDARMYTTNALEEISKRFGITATFIDPAERKSRRMTRQDLNKAVQKSKG